MCDPIFKRSHNLSTLDEMTQKKSSRKIYVDHAYKLRPHYSKKTLLCQDFVQDDHIVDKCIVFSANSKGVK